MNTLALYIHWPFCLAKCPYCDFNSHVASHIDHDAFVQAYTTELTHFLAPMNQPVISSIFFGGGTPSLMPLSTVDAILNTISSLAICDHDTEITLEANPTSSESAHFSSLKTSGINRFSVGIQSFNDKHLHFLGRQHSADEAKSVIRNLQSLGVNYSFDLIYCLPNQSLAAWDKELQEALAFKPNHLSLYQLTIEKGTPFYQMHRDKDFIMPSEDISADFFIHTDHIMTQSGFEHYEVSNFAKPGFHSKHNTHYWRYEPYLGIGPGAHSRCIINGKWSEQMMVHRPKLWRDHVYEHQHGVQSCHSLDVTTQIEEHLLMGLRLAQGINITTFNKRYGVELPNMVKKSVWSQLINDGYLIYNNNQLFIPKNHQLLTQTILLKLIESIEI